MTGMHTNTQTNSIMRGVEVQAEINITHGERFFAWFLWSNTSMRRLGMDLWNHHNYKIAIGPDRTAVERDGVTRFEANAGVVVRDYKRASNRLSFTVTTIRATRITTRELSSGALSLSIDDQPPKTIAAKDGSVVLAIAAGRHRVVETWK
jgi:hypothetical protein